MTLVTALVIVATTMMPGCSSVGPGGNGAAGTTNTVTAQPTPAQRLEPVLAALKHGDLAAASEAITTLESAGVTPEIVAFGRGRLARAEGRAPAALEAFAVAAESEDSAVVTAARLYRALLLAERDDPSADAALGDVLSGAPNKLVPPADRVKMWVLLAEGRLQAGDTLSGLTALSHGFDATEHLESTDTEDRTTAAWFSSRAHEVASELSLDALRAVWTDSDGLAKAAVGYAMVRRQLANDDLAATHAILSETLAALALVGDAERANEIERIVQIDQMDAGPATSVRIGAVLPLTGESRGVGRRFMAGILQAIGAFSSGGGRRLTVVFQDSGSDPARARAAVEQLDALDVIAVLGPIDATAARAAADEASARALPLIALTPARAQLGSDALRFGIDVGEELGLLTDRVASLRPPVAIAIHPDNPFGRAMTDRFAREVEARGGILVEALSYTPGNPDLRDIAKRAASLDFDVVFLPDTMANASLVASFLAQENIWSRPSDDFEPPERDARRFATFVGPSTWYVDAHDLAQSERRYLDGAYFAVSWAREQSSPRTRRFLERFEHLYGRTPGVYEAIAFDATELLRELVLTRSLYERTKLREALLSLDDRVGVTGTFDFEDGHASPTPMLLRVSEEGLEPLPAHVTLPASEGEQPDGVPSDRTGDKPGASLDGAEPGGPSGALDGTQPPDRIE